MSTEEIINKIVNILKFNSIRIKFLRKVVLEKYFLKNQGFKIWVINISTHTQKVGGMCVDTLSDCLKD
jgi:hypothetical protein